MYNGSNFLFNMCPNSFGRLKLNEFPNDLNNHKVHSFKFNKTPCDQDIFELNNKFVDRNPYLMNSYTNNELFYKMDLKSEIRTHINISQPSKMISKIQNQKHYLNPVCDVTLNNNTILSNKNLPKISKSKNSIESQIYELQIESNYIVFKPFSKEFINKINKSHFCNKPCNHSIKNISYNSFKSKLKSLTILNNLYELMEIILNGGKLTQRNISGLTKDEYYIFHKIIEKKNYTGIKIFLNRLSNKKSKEITFKNQIISNKRKEESLKFVFRLIVKEFQKSFCIKKKLDIQNRDHYEDEFYKYYYSEFINGGFISLEHLKTPYFKNNKNKSENKTLNKIFFTNINLSKKFTNLFNKCLIEIICNLIPCSLNKSKSKSMAKINQNVIKSILNNNQNELFKKFLNWELKIKKKGTQKKDIRIIGSEIENKVFKFPWTVWEIRNAFIMTMLSINEFVLASDYLANSYLGDNESNKNLNPKYQIINELKNSKQKEYYIKREISRIKKHSNKFYWLTLINKSLYNKNFKIISNEIYHYEFNQDEFLDFLRNNDDIKKYNWKFRVHLYIILFNMLIDQYIKNKKLEDLTKMCFDLIFNELLQKCVFVFNKLNVLIKGREYALLKDCPLLIEMINQIPELNYECFLRVIPATKFIAQLQCLLVGVKNKLMLKDLTNFINKNLCSHFGNKNLENLLKRILVQN